MALVKVWSRLKHRVNFCAILSEYVVIGKNCTGERRQEWGLIRRLRTWSKRFRRVWKGKVRLPWKISGDTPYINGEMQPSCHPASTGHPGSLCSLVLSSYKPVPLRAVVWFSYEAPLSQQQTSRWYKEWQPFLSGSTQYLEGTLTLPIK